MFHKYHVGMWYTHYQTFYSNATLCSNESSIIFVCCTNVNNKLENEHHQNCDPFTLYSIFT